MKIPNSGPEILRLLGYIIFVFGALSTIQYLLVVLFRPLPIDLGIGLGNGAITFLGLVAIAASDCLIKLDRRLKNLEDAVKSRGLYLP